MVAITTIAAIQGDDYAVIAFDSKVVDGEGGGKTFLLPADIPKVVRNNGLLLGAAGDLRAINLLCSFKSPAPGAGIEPRELDSWVNQKFVPALKDWFDRNGSLKEGGHQSLVLAVVNCTVYEIGNEFEWLRDERGLYAIGSGGDYALGYLYGRPRPKTPEEARKEARKALEISSTLDAGSGPPIHTIVVRKKKD